jgi:hypothetical protein
MQGQKQYGKPGQQKSAGGQNKSAPSKPTHTLKVKSGEGGEFETICNLFESVKKDTGESYLKGNQKDDKGNTVATFYIFPRSEKPST